MCGLRPAQQTRQRSSSAAAERVLAAATWDTHTHSLSLSLSLCLSACVCLCVAGATGTYRRFPPHHRFEPLHCHQTHQVDRHRPVNQTIPPPHERSASPAEDPCSKRRLKRMAHASYVMPLPPDGVRVASALEKPARVPSRAGG